MIGQVYLFGFYIPWLMVLAIITIPVQWSLRRILVTLHFYRWVWHPALFDLALYVLILFILSQLTKSIS